MLFLSQKYPSWVLSFIHGRPLSWSLFSSLGCSYCNRLAIKWGIIYCGLVPLMKLFEWVRDSVWVWVTLELHVLSRTAFGRRGWATSARILGRRLLQTLLFDHWWKDREGNSQLYRLAVAKLYLDRYTDDYIWVIPRSITVVNKTRFANSLSANAFRKCTGGNKERSPCLVIHSLFCVPEDLSFTLCSWETFPECRCCFGTNALVSFCNSRKIDLTVACCRSIFKVQIVSIAVKFRELWKQKNEVNKYKWNI